MAGEAQLPRGTTGGNGPRPQTAPWGMPLGSSKQRDRTHTRARTDKATAPLITLMSLNEPGVVYDAAKAPDLQDIPIMLGCNPNDMLWQEQALKTPTATPNLTSVLTRRGYHYHTTWVKGVSQNGEVQVHVHRHLGIKARLAAYELVRPTWHLNVINVHVPFGDPTDTFLEHHMQTYRQPSMMGPTVIIGGFNAATTLDDRGGATYT